MAFKNCYFFLPNLVTFKNDIKQILKSRVMHTSTSAMHYRRSFWNFNYWKHHQIDQSRKVQRITSDATNYEYQLTYT